MKNTKPSPLCIILGEIEFAKFTYHSLIVHL